MTAEGARVRTPVVYVALTGNDVALKVGVSRHGLLWRWKGILGVMDLRNRPNLRPNEVVDGESLAKLTAGKQIEVWFKQPTRVQIPYAEELVQGDFCGRHAEEIFLDQYYEPAFGMPLEGRRGASSAS